jgi:[ribosomal protein S18]-alanine N-acetyltransferase
MPPLGPRVAIRGATLDDADHLEQIESASFTGDRLSRRSLNAHLKSPTADVFVATLDRKVAGYAMMFYRRRSTIGRLYSIATSPAARGHGIARRLMTACERSARRRACRAVRLEVREDNAAAIHLYETLGYVPMGRYEDYYDDHTPALRLEKDLASAKPRRNAGAA